MSSVSVGDDSADASRTGWLPVPGKRPGGVNRDPAPSVAGGSGSVSSGVSRVAGRVGYRSRVAGLAAGAAGGRQPGSFIARGGSASESGWGNGFGSQVPLPARPTDAASSEAGGNVSGAKAISGLPVAAIGGPPSVERPKPIAQTSPKPVPAQTIAPSSRGRLDFRGGTTRSCREERAVSGTGSDTVLDAGSCIGGSPGKWSRGNTTSVHPRESPFAGESQFRQPRGSGEDGSRTCPASRRSSPPRWRRSPDPPLRGCQPPWQQPPQVRPRRR